MISEESFMEGYRKGYLAGQQEMFKLINQIIHTKPSQQVIVQCASEEQAKEIIEKFNNGGLLEWINQK